MNKKLKLNWVKDAIGEEYTHWKRGDIVKINTQTGTGKTYFIKNVLIPYIAEYETMLYVCNRINLKRQLKKDLLEIFNKSVPYMKDSEGEYILDKNQNKILNIEAIDKITTIGNITITSYHAIQDSALDSQYGLGFCQLEYDYIILDEVHYIFADGSFNNRCRLAFEMLIKQTSHSSIKIFISATMDELNYPISKMMDRYLGRKPKIWDYTTGIDYTYLKTTYFRYIKDIITIIKNDKTDNKWLIFVSDLKDADKIKKEIGTDICNIIKAGDKTDEVKNIIANSKFDCKVLCTTKAMDNGINFEDDKLTNIVIMAWDKTTFIQMLGRKRVDIDNAQQINLYIATRFKKSFTSKLMTCNIKREEIELFNKDKNLFNRKYDNSLNSIAKMEELFYKNFKDGEWKINIVGDLRLLLDIKYFNKMVDKFKAEGEFAFIKEQLKWLELENTFNCNDYVEEVILEDDIMGLEKYLENMFNEKIILLRLEDRKELIEKINLIDGSHSNIKENVIKYVKNIETLNSHLQNTLKIDYLIEEFSHSKTINGKTSRYKASWRIVKIIK